MKAQGVDKTQFWCGNWGSRLQSTDIDSGWFKAKGIYWKDARSSQSWRVSARPSLKETGEIRTWKSGIKDCRRNEHTAERVWLPPRVIQLWSYVVCLLRFSIFKFQGTSVQLALDHMNTPFIGDSRVFPIRIPPYGTLKGRGNSPTETKVMVTKGKGPGMPKISWMSTICGC